MAITVKHSKVSTIPDEADTSLVRPSDWNADHTLTGTIDIANGGTGQTTANAAFNALVPSQTGNTGKYLTTNGTDTSWATNPLGTVTSVAATAGTGIAVTGSPITTSGTLNITNTAPDQTVVLNSGTGISTSGTYPNFTVTNTAPDQVVALTGAGTTVVTGTYPNFTITSTDSTTGTVTSVAATAGTGISVTGSPITTSGTLNITNTAPDQTVVLTAGTGISTSGTYPNFTITNTSPSLGGDVVGPASATDNAIARFDTTTGKLIQNSTVTINDNGTLEAVNGIAFDTTPTSAPTAEGSLSWNSSDGTLDLVMKGGNVVQQIGEEQYYTVRNETGSTIANGTPVMANGVTSGSGRITVTPAIANGSIDELRFIGLTTESIASGINGYVTSFGYVRGLDTRGTPYGETWAEGDFIYVSPTTAGYLTNVEPTAPNLKIVVAIVITRNQTSGVLLVRPTAYPHITHLSDVNISSPTSGNTLIYDAVQGRWENASITGGTGLSVTNGAGTIALANTGVTSAVAGTGISVSGSTGAVTVTNTAPDQTVAISAGTGISVTGTYPNFTVTNTAPDVPFTYTSTYIPFGQGTTTPNQSANLTFDGTSLTAPVQRASNGIVTNSKTIGTSFTIPATDNAMSSGPVTLSAGVTVTVSSGSRWVVL
jgi:hypothetical protein